MARLRDLLGPVRALWQGALDLALPPRCLVCLDPTWDAPLPSLCDLCCARIPAPERRCPRCARPVGPHEAPPGGGCPACVGPRAVADALGKPALSGRQPLDRVVAAHAYTGTPRALVVGLKFRGRVGAGALLAADLAERLAEAGVPGDLVVAVPLSSRRRRQRGYDQAALLARAVAHGLDLPYAAQALRRRRDTPAQTSLSRAGRRRSVRGAFRGCPRRVRGRCVILVDDVLTTGATARAAALALRRAGAAAVVAAVACRA